MMIADAQLHIWAEDRPDRPWRPGETGRAHRPEPVSAESLLLEMDAAGVRRAVLVPPSWEGDRNDLVLDAARRFPDRFAAIGRLPIESLEGRAEFARLRGTPGLYGYRFTFHQERTRRWLTDGTADWLWPAAAEAGLVTMVHVPGALDIIDGVAERFPTLRLVVDHLALERPHKDDAAFAHIPHLLRLARHDNVAVKATALPAYSTEPYPYYGIHKYIRQVVEAFGPRRVFWGSDLTRIPCSYDQAIGMFTEHMPWLSDSDLELIMGRAICDWLGWPYSQQDLS